MQATVHTFDATTRCGAVILDDGIVLPFEAPAFNASGLRHLRLGQRLTIDLDEDGTVSAVRIRGIAHPGTTEPIG